VPLRLILHMIRIYLRRDPPGMPLFLISLASGGIVGGIVASTRTWKIPLASGIGSIVAGSSLVVWKIGRRVWANSAIVRYGRLVDAPILRVRPAYTAQGKRQGSQVDLLIPVEHNHISAGSFWIAEENETAWDHEHHSVRVLCLPYVPGTWHVLESIGQDTVLHELSWNQSTAQLEPDHR
jgi:hypothetical protein